MAYNYRMDVTMEVDLTVEADSYAKAEELVKQNLFPVMSLGWIFASDTTINGIESDDDPEEEID